MRFTERELTEALTGAAKSVLGAQDKGVRRGRRTADQAWEELSRYQRWQLLDGLGDQLLAVLVALPDVEVAYGERATYSDDEVGAAIRSVAGEQVTGLRGAALLKARVALVQLALSHVAPRADPDTFVVPDHL